jgi:molybdopterin molybdotransferase
MDDEAETPQRIARLTSLADVLARIDALVTPVEPRDAKVVAAQGCVLAADVVAPSGVPASALALRDGFAVRAEDTAEAGGYAPALLAAPPARVDVGDPLPPGADAVAAVDVVVARRGRYEALAPVAAGDGVLPAQGDVAADAILRPAGERLRSIDIAALRAGGIEHVRIRAPRVRLVRTRPAGDAVLDAIFALVAGAVEAAGAVVLDQRPDAELGLSTALGREDADAVIAVGGTGSGRRDRSVQTLAAAGRVEAHGIAISPGETAAFGVTGSRPVLLLPGRLDAALAAWLLLGRKMLARLSGSVEAEKLVCKAGLVRKISSTLGLAELVPVRMHDGGAEPIASSYVPLSALARADGWVFVPADSEGYPPGAEVVIRPWP